MLRHSHKVPSLRISRCARFSTSRLAKAQLGAFKVPEPSNEPVRSFEPGSTDRQGVLTALERLRNSPADIPLVIGGKEIYTETKFSQTSPYDYSQVLATVSSADHKHVQSAIEAAATAKRDWENASWADRAAVFLRAADLIGHKYRYDMLATTMIGQGKNVYQAEIDATCELIDFLKFNARYAEQLYDTQPKHHATGVWNRAEYRALEGFVLAVTPFNFTAIAGNLVGAPAMVGNTVLWKPSNTAVLSNYTLFKIFEEAGVPAGVINFLPTTDNAGVVQSALGHRDFAALHYTGSTSVFMGLYQQIARNLGQYRSYPRIVGETGGKNFHLVHPSAHLDNAVINTVRGAYEFQGQKCSATSRAYIPESLWPRFRQRFVQIVESIQQGDATTERGFHNFSGPVIHQQSFEKLATVIADNLADPDLELVVGGQTDKSVGYYVKPTAFVTTNPDHANLRTEFFGPLLTFVVYKDADFESILDKVESTGSYGLTGSIFATDRAAIDLATQRLRHAAGNFYINDKSTGAVVGQQWFGGSRLSGTNDKAGSANLVSRFVSVRNIKENFIEPTTILYPSNA